MDQTRNVNQTEQHETISLMGEVVIWQTFWRSLPWISGQSWWKVNKHASSGITLATGTAGPVIQRKDSVLYLLLNLTLCMVPQSNMDTNFIYKRIHFHQNSSELVVLQCNYCVHEETKRFPEWIHVCHECVRTQSVSWPFLAPNLMLFSITQRNSAFPSWDRIAQDFPGSFNTNQFPHPENKNKRVVTSKGF